MMNKLPKYPAYKSSGAEWLGEIPEHWEVKPFRFIGKTQNGISKGAEYFGTGFPFVSYSDAYRDIKLPTEVSGLADSSIYDRKQYSVIEGDVFLQELLRQSKRLVFRQHACKQLKTPLFRVF